MSIILDGTNDYFTATSLLISNGKTGTVSVWFKPANVTDTQAILIARNTGSGATAFYWDLAIGGAFDRISVVARNSAGSGILGIVANDVGLVVGTWYHIMAAWTLGDSEGQIYLNGSDLSPTQTFVDEAIPYGDASAWQVGALTDSGDIPGSMFDGTLDDLYLTTEYIDLTDSENRRLFYGREGTTVGLGSHGTRPTGARPEILLTHGPNNYGTNSGSGGNFSRVGEPTFFRGRPAAVETLSRGFYGERWRESERSGIPFRDSRLVIEPASGLEVARREFSTDRDEINRRKRFGTSIFEY